MSEFTYDSDYACDKVSNAFGGKTADAFGFVTTPFKIRNKIRLIELFAGIGSQAAALQAIGADFERWVVVDSDEYAIKSYNAIHGTDFVAKDIKDVHGGDLNITDKEKYTYICFYSFPCTDLSLSGNRAGMKEGSGTRSSLLWEVKRILNECTELPQVLIMENVPNIHGVENMKHFQKWLDYLSEKGYCSFWQDMNARDFGVPQNRDRCIVVSLLGQYSFQFPKPYVLEKTLYDCLEDEVDERLYIKTASAKAMIDKLVREGKLPLGVERSVEDNLPKAEDTEVNDW